MGAAAVAAALMLRLAGSGILAPVVRAMQQPEMMSFLLYLQTGRVVRLAAPTTEWSRESPGLTASPPQAAERPAFSDDDLDLVEMRYTCDYRPALAPLLTSPLDWDLTGSAPTVLILHSHATESYTQVPGESYTSSADFRTLDEHYNMVSVGDALARQLEEGGITVLHDRTLHDSPSYDDAYENSRAAARDYLARYPSIRVVLDLHRDAAEDAAGDQVATCATINGSETARLMLVVGTDEAGEAHPDWQENLAFALKLQVVLERQSPGLVRYTSLRMSRFNQDLRPGALLVEIGTAGDTHAQALTAAALLGDGLLALAHGST